MQLTYTVKIKPKTTFLFTFASVCHVNILRITVVALTGVTAWIIDAVSVCATSVSAPCTFIYI